MKKKFLHGSVIKLTREDTAQLSMFPDPKREREQELDRLIDGLRHRFGTDTIVPIFFSNSTYDFINDSEFNVPSEFKNFSGIFSIFYPLFFSFDLRKK